MPGKVLDLQNLLSSASDISALFRLPHESWLPVLQHPCDFGPDIFTRVSLNLIKNPNINSSLLFRADILYDSLNGDLTDEPLPEAERIALLRRYYTEDLPGFHVTRILIRRMIPRNPQLDKPIAQTCLILKSTGRSTDLEQSLVIYIPHAPTAEDLPWYHPQLHSLAYLHTWNTSLASTESPGTITLHYRLFSSESLPLSPRLFRTGQHLLSTVYRHGQGQLAGYTKRVHHDTLLSQQRVQDTYTELKRKHANRLCDNWVEKTEPSKHVFEDLGIAAFLIELWKDMYGTATFHHNASENDGHGSGLSFPGFVDIGCGNGVLVDVLIREGYRGWGFDARRRKTWGTFEEPVQSHLKQMILVPQPLFELNGGINHLNHANGSIVCRSPTLGKGQEDDVIWHNGLFPLGTFIISNHADELTAWTPLLASISASPFLAIPCCSHNLSGLRFRAPSVFNSNSADVLAPSFFSEHINKSKSIAIAIACSDNAELFGEGPEQGDLKDLSLKSRSKQPSAYSSLCDWVAHLAARVGYKVEREMMRLPTTRNVGIICRSMMPEFENESLDKRRERVTEIASQEKVDGQLWVERARGLVGGQSSSIH